MFPSGPAAMPRGKLAMSSENSVIWPDGVMRAIVGVTPSFAVTQRLPSTPAAMSRMGSPDGRENSAAAPAVVTRPTNSTPRYWNQRLPSGPATIWSGQMLGSGWGTVKSLNCPPGRKLVQVAPPPAHPATHSAPSGPRVIPCAWTPLPSWLVTMYSVNEPAVVIWATTLTSSSVTHMAPSGPAARLSKTLPVVLGNSVATPEGVTFPILSGFVPRKPLVRRYHTFPSGPGAILVRSPSSVRG